MVEGQRRQRVDRMPAQAGRAAREQVGWHQRHMRHRDRPAARIASRPAEGGELLEIGAVQPGSCAQRRPAESGVGVPVGMDEVAGQRASAPASGALVGGSSATCSRGLSVSSTTSTVHRMGVAAASGEGRAGRMTQGWNQLSCNVVLAAYPVSTMTTNLPPCTSWLIDAQNDFCAPASAQGICRCRARTPTCAGWPSC